MGHCSRRSRLLPVRAAVAVAAGVFGIWHIQPTLGAAPANYLANGVLLTGLAVVGGCLATVLAGVVFAWLRLGSGSLLAPALLHLRELAGSFAADAAFRHA